MKTYTQMIAQLKKQCAWYERAIARSKQRHADSQAMLRQFYALNPRCVARIAEYERTAK